MKINYMGMLLIFVSISSMCILSCNKTQTILKSESDDNMEYYFYVADSAGTLRTVFTVKQDVFFHFGMINTGDIPQDFTISDGGPTLVLFEVFKNNKLFGTSDDGASYAYVDAHGQLAPGDTLRYHASWYSNKFHDSLTVGNYFTRVKSHFYIEDIVPFACIDSMSFEITSD